MSVVPQDKALPAINRIVHCLLDRQARMRRIAMIVESIDDLGREGAPSATFQKLMHGRRHLLAALELEGAACVEFVELEWGTRDDALVER